MSDPRVATTVIVGRDSNLSQRLASRLHDARLVSGRDVVERGLRGPAFERTFDLILNAFQPASRLDDLSDPVGYVSRTVGAIARVLADLPGDRCRRLIYTSSAAVYGNSVECREDGPIAATNLHAGLKLAGESMVRSVCSAQGVDFTIARVFNMYGGADSFSIISKIIRSGRNGTTLTVANHGNAVRDFIHVDDVVRSYEAILSTTDLPVVNVASGLGVSVRTLLDAAELHGVPISTSNQARTEITVSTADVERLDRLVSTREFRRATDFVIAELTSSEDRRTSTSPTS